LPHFDFAAFLQAAKTLIQAIQNTNKHSTLKETMKSFKCTIAALLRGLFGVAFGIGSGISGHANTITITPTIAAFYGNISGGDISDGSYFTGYQDGDEFHGILSLSLAPISSQTVAAASLSLFSPYNIVTNPAGGVLSLYYFAGPPASATYNNLVAGDLIGTSIIPSESTGSSSTFTVNLNALGIRDINNESGTNFSVGLSFNEVTPVDNDAIFYNAFNDASKNSLEVSVAVPEPSTYAMLTVGFGMLVLVSRRRYILVG
jgi:hypothetical protein